MSDARQRLEKDWLEDQSENQNRVSFIRFMTSDGRPSVPSTLATAEITGDYSSAPQEFYFEFTQAEADLFEKVVFTRAIIYVEDDGSFDVSSYGNGIALTNGLRFYFEDVENNKVGDTDDIGFRVKRNGDWTQFAFDSEYITFGVGNNIWVTRFTFAKLGFTIKFDEIGERFVLVANDNFTGLDNHRIMLEGYAVVKE